jgi:hypothetical protein
MTYEVDHWDGLRWHDIRIKFHEDWFGHASNINVIYLNNLRGCNVGITDRWDLWCMLLRRLHVAWLYIYIYIYIYTKFYYYRFRNSSNIKGITSTILEAVVLVLLRRGIYEVHHWDGFVWRDNIPSFIMIGTGVQAISRCCLSNFGACNVGITDTRYLWSTRWDGLRCHDRHPSFIKISSSIQQLLQGDKYTDTHTHTDKERARRFHKPTCIFFKLRKVG